MPRLSTPLAILCGLTAMASTAAAQDWTATASLPGTGRHHPVNFTLDGYGYVVTGSSGGNTTDFFRYDPGTDAWTVLTDFPGPARSYSYGGAYDGKGYLGFGQGTSYLRDLWEYDPVAESWTELAPCPGTARTHPAFVITDDGKIFVGMGGSAGGNLNDWWEYDIATNVWAQKAFLPGPNRHHPYYFNIGDTPYVGFGHGAGIFKDFYRFERDTESWTRMTDFPSEGRVAGTQFSYGGKGYVLSGEGDDHVQFPTGEFWEYDPDTDSWTQLAPHPGSSRWAPGNFVIDDTVYLMCGLSTSRLESDMWKFQFMDPAAVEEPVLPNQIAFRVSPNPVTGQQLRIFDTPEAAHSMRLLDVQGREVSGFGYSAGLAELPTGLASGQYFLVLRSQGGTETARAITVLR